MSTMNYHDADVYDRVPNRDLYLYSRGMNFIITSAIMSVIVSPIVMLTIAALMV